VKLSERIDVDFVVDMLRNDKLVWSGDFEAIRLPLADLIVSMASALNAANEMVASIGSPYVVEHVEELSGCKCGGNCKRSGK
jgi:hypothetical protein